MVMMADEVMGSGLDDMRGTTLEVPLRTRIGTRCERGIARAGARQLDAPESSRQVCDAIGNGGKVNGGPHPPTAHQAGRTRPTSRREMIEMASNKASSTSHEVKQGDPSVSGDSGSIFETLAELVLARAEEVTASFGVPDIEGLDELASDCGLQWLQITIVREGTVRVLIPVPDEDCMCETAHAAAVRICRLQRRSRRLSGGAPPPGDLEPLADATIYLDPMITTASHADGFAITTRNPDPQRPWFQLQVSAPDDPRCQDHARWIANAVDELCRRYQWHTGYVESCHTTRCA